MLGTFAGAISSSAISRGTSFLKDKINKKIFSDNINVYDKPDILKGLGSQSFDLEGVKTNTLKLVERGVLKYYLVDTYNGKKLNLKSNGRCGGTSNLYFDNGKISYKDLINSEFKEFFMLQKQLVMEVISNGDYSVGSNRISN
jgi:PmbA protein